MSARMVPVDAPEGYEFVIEWGGWAEAASAVGTLYLVPVGSRLVGGLPIPSRGPWSWEFLRRRTHLRRVSKRLRRHLLKRLAAGPHKFERFGGAE